MRYTLKGCLSSLAIMLMLLGASNIIAVVTIVYFELDYLTSLIISLVLVSVGVLLDRLLRFLGD